MRFIGAKGAVSVLAAGLTIATFAGFVSGTAAWADTVTLQETAADNNTRDNTLYQPRPPANTQVSNGAGSYFFVGRTNEGYLSRAVLRFDLSRIPAGSTVTATTLTLRMNRTKAGNEPVRLHRLLADWGEGTSNADGQEGTGVAPTAGDATWAHRFFNTAFWTTAGAGGDFAATASVSQTVGGNGLYSWSSTGLAGDVQLWANSPVSNFGWILIGNETVNQTAKRFSSAENGTLADRPQLVVTFTPPVVSGACCVAGNCSVRTQTECTSQGGTFQGNGTTCTPNPCVLPTGACCAANGGCTVVSSAVCAGTGGTYRGDGSTCTPNPCPQPTGACCAPNGSCSEVSQAQCASQGGSYGGDGTTCAATRCPVILTPFVDPLPIPAPLTPISGTIGGTATYELAIREVRQQLHRDLPPTTVWGYHGLYPGPTIEATTGQPVTLIWRNDLRDATGTLRTEHYLPVDTCLKGPDTAGSTPRVVTHLHGGHVPAAYDGYPEATFLPGGGTTYIYPNNQPAATLWYHDHAMGITRLNVIMGLAGFYLIRDAVETSLNLPSGAYEIPLAIQDRTFRPDGSFDYPAAWQEHFFGDTLLVNGKVWPYLEVRRGKYRFRTLNGSTSRTYTLSLSVPGVPFHQIGTEGGLLEAPVPISSLTLGPGERADLVIDFEGLPAGTEVILTNSAPIMFPGSPDEGVIPNVMKFIVQNQLGHTAPLPPVLRPIERLQEADAVEHRQFDLRKGADPCTGSAWLINGLRFDDLTEFPELGNTEVWSFINSSGVMHPMHIHLVMFQVLDRQEFDVVGGAIVPVGPRIPPLPGEAGWKDTTQAPPGVITRVIARFEDYTGKFAYHCHIIEHEDHEMMRQFQAIACGNGVVEPTETCDDGNLANGDRCSVACRLEEFVQFEGSAVATGSVVQLTVEGRVIAVTTTAGQSAAAVAAALAAAINADPELQRRRISADAIGATLVVGGVANQLAIGDPGLRAPLTLRLGPAGLWWSSVGDRIGSDVLRGDLVSLRAGGGDFTASTQVCLANNLPATSLPYTAVPGPGEAWWLLVRIVTPSGSGTYDNGGPGQVGSRDAEIAASPNACP